MQQLIYVLPISLILRFMNVMVLKAGSRFKEPGQRCQRIVSVLLTQKGAISVIRRDVMRWHFLMKRRLDLDLIVLLSHLQNFENKEGLQLFEQVIDKVNTWGTPDNLMYVVGATRGEGFIKIREHAPDHFLLVPGVGAQGGSLEDVCKFGMNKDCGLLVNSTRGIIYASNGRDFAERAREEALILQKEMEVELLKAGIIS